METKLRPISKDGWLSLLKPGDIGLIHNHGFFSTLQNWYRKKFKEGSERANHGFFIVNPPEIIEANGLFVSRGKIIKSIGDKTKVWAFRYSKLDHEDFEEMEAFANGALKSKGHYSVGGIGQFVLKFFGVKKKISDKAGVFCTEFTSLIINEAELPYITDKKPFDIDPTVQLNWFLNEGKKVDWYLAAYYDGAGNFFVS